MQWRIQNLRKRGRGKYSEREARAYFLVTPLLGRNLGRKVVISTYSYNVDHIATTTCAHTLEKRMASAILCQALLQSMACNKLTTVQLIN